MNRREFIKSAAAAAGALTVSARVRAAEDARAQRPNILWIVSEDNNPFLGCYGNKLVHTPTIDALARDGVLYENCFSQAPVCAPSRFTLITGMYATSCGPAEHMRAQGKISAFVRGFPAWLRDAGYYCTNHTKTDYNAPIRMNDAWDDSTARAHWRNRPAGKPFFAVFNHEVTHESQLFPANMAKYKPVKQPVDPAAVDLPSYHPDTPEFRRDRANYYDHMNRLDDQVARLLKQLEDDGLAEDTIVFYYADNGGILPRSKRFCYDSGLHVPLIIRFPKKFQHLAPSGPGSRIDDPVSFVDFAPTVLSLAGVPIPKHFEGHAFAGPQKSPPQQYAFCFRNRMDERYDFVRTARDKRYRYIRNYMPHLMHGQHVEYQFQQRSYQVWEKLNREGKLTGPQKSFWEPKPTEELYDLQADRDEVRNLVASPDHRQILDRMSAALDEHMLRTRDNGFIPEGSPLEGYANTRDDKSYPLAKIMEVARTAAERDILRIPRLVERMTDENECIRYWAVMGCLMQGEAVGRSSDALHALVDRLLDKSESVQVAAAEALCRTGVKAGWTFSTPYSTVRSPDPLAVLQQCLLKSANPWVRLQAANALQNIGTKARPALDALRQARSDPNGDVQKACKYTFAVLSGQAVDQ